MFQLDDLRKTRVWQEAHEEGEASERQRLIRKWRSEGRTIKQIAEELDIPVADVRRLARNSDK